MEFENGGLFSVPVKGHVFFQVMKDFDWVFKGIDHELTKNGYSVGYESGYIGHSADYDAIAMSIEMFVGKDIDGDVVEASFDVTIVENDSRKGRLKIAPMTGSVCVPGIVYQEQENGLEVTPDPCPALIVKVAGSIHDMASTMIPAHKNAME